MRPGDGAGADAKLHHVAPAEDVDPAGHGLQEACPAVSWYIPAAHGMQADVAAPPLLYVPDAQLPDTAARPGPAQYIPGVQGMAAVRLAVGQKLPAGHSIPADIAWEGQKLPAGQGVQDAKAAPLEE